MSRYLVNARNRAESTEQSRFSPRCAEFCSVGSPRAGRVFERAISSSRFGVLAKAMQCSATATGGDAGGGGGPLPAPRRATAVVVVVVRRRRWWRGQWWQLLGQRDPARWEPDCTSPGVGAVGGGGRTGGGRGSSPYESAVSATASASLSAGTAPQQSIASWHIQTQIRCFSPSVLTAAWNIKAHRRVRVHFQLLVFDQK